MKFLPLCSALAFAVALGCGSPHTFAEFRKGEARAESAYAVGQPCGGTMATFYGMYPGQPNNGQPYVDERGWWETMRTFPPEILVVGDHEGAVRYAVRQFHPVGTKVFGYVNTCYANNAAGLPNPVCADRPLAEVKARIKQAMALGADGVFLDEGSHTATGKHGEYYRPLYDYIKSFGRDKTVVLNPGSLDVDESVMSITDILHMECQWDGNSSTDAWRESDWRNWRWKYSPRRFSGVDGECRKIDPNHPAQGIKDTYAARWNNVGYFYPTPSEYFLLADWYSQWISADAVCRSGSQVTINAVDRKGTPLAGIFVRLEQDGHAIEGYTPFTTSVPNGGAYVAAEDYGGFGFQYWVNTWQRSQKVDIQGNREFVAVFNTPTHVLTIESIDTGGTPRRGLGIDIWSLDRTIHQQGATPATFVLPPGEYDVTTSSSAELGFKDWSDGFTGATRHASLRENGSLVARYGFVR